MSKIISFFIGLGMLVLLLSGGIAKLFEFFAWLFLLQNTQADISIGGQIFVRIATFLQEKMDISPLVICCAGEIVVLRPARYVLGGVLKCRN